MNSEKKLFIFSTITVVTTAVYTLGAISYKENLPPIPELNRIYIEILELLNPSSNLLYKSGIKNSEEIFYPHPEKASEGLILISESSGESDRSSNLKVITRNGTVVHEWFPRWNKVWGDAEGNFPGDRRPSDGYGMYLHGVALSKDGGYIANFDHLSTFKSDICGNIEWKLDNLGHHSVYIENDNEIWVGSENYIENNLQKYKNHNTPYRSWILQKIDTNGNIIKNISVNNVLEKNGLTGLLYLSNISNQITSVMGDTLHLNDIEVFPKNYKSELFSPGDLMFSLRNINAFFVINQETLKIKYFSIGQTLRHHDPDFLPNGNISVFDNRNLRPSKGIESSRVIEINPITGNGKSEIELEIETANGNPFFTDIMGNHQTLSNGNKLLVVSEEGTVMELDRNGEIIWSYTNWIDNNNTGRIFNAEILPKKIDKKFFLERKENCL